MTEKATPQKNVFQRLALLCLFCASCAVLLHFYFLFFSGFLTGMKKYDAAHTVSLLRPISGLLLLAAKISGAISLFGIIKFGRKGILIPVLVAFILVFSYSITNRLLRKHKEPNQAPQPTTMLVMPPAAQESRQAWSRLI